MAVEDIFSRLANHMIKGLMTHEELANYYDFLGLGGYKRCHEYQFYAESKSYRRICKYFINHYNKLIPEMYVETPSIIPDNWYRYTRQDVDTNTKRNAVRNGLSLWISWERDTKQFYQSIYRELMDTEEVASACVVAELIEDVDCELKKAERYQLNKEAIDYNIEGIIAEQNELHNKYKCKMKSLF